MRFFLLSSISAACLLRSLSASWTADVDEITSGQHDRSSCSASALMQRSHHLALDDSPKPKDKKDDSEKDSLGKKVYMDQKGYEKILKLDDNTEMYSYIDRIIEGLGLTVEDEKKLAEFSLDHLNSKKSSNFKMLVRDLLDAFRKEKWLKSVVPKASGDDAELTEDGYKAVLQQSSEKEMAVFMKRYLCDKNIEVQGKGKLSGMAPFYSGSRSIQTFSRLEEEFKQLQEQPHSWLVSKEPSKIKGCGPEQDEGNDSEEGKDGEDSSESVEDVTCDFTADNFVSKFYIDGKDKTGSLKGDLDDYKSKKTVTFKSDVSKLAFQVNDAEKGCRNGGFAISCRSKKSDWTLSSNNKAGWKVFSKKSGWSKDSLKEKDYPPEVDGKKWFEKDYKAAAHFSAPVDSLAEFSGRFIKADGKSAQDLCGGGKSSEDNHWFFIYTHP